MTELSKIAINDRCASDKLLYKFLEPTLPFWNNLNFTPNMITTLGAISSYLSLDYFYKGNIPYSILFIILRAYFDYTDGALARKYKQISKFGDLYDHIVDVVFYVALNLLIYNKFENKERSFIILGILNVFSLNMVSVAGCEELKYNKVHESDFLSTTIRLCNKNLYNKHSKTYCNGNLYILIIIIMILYKYIE